MGNKTIIRTNEDLRDYLAQQMAGKAADGIPAADQLAANADIRPIYTQDIWIYRMVVICLSVVILGVVAGVIIISTQHKTEEDINKHVPVVLVSLISTAVGALAGLLAPSPGQSRT